MDLAPLKQWLSDPANGIDVAAISINGLKADASAVDAIQTTLTTQNIPVLGSIGAVALRRWLSKSGRIVRVERTIADTESSDEVRSILKVALMALERQEQVFDLSDSEQQTEMTSLVGHPFTQGELGELLALGTTYRTIASGFAGGARLTTKGRINRAILEIRGAA